MEIKQLQLAWSVLLPPRSHSVPSQSQLTVNLTAEMLQALTTSPGKLISSTSGWRIMASVTPAGHTYRPGRSNESSYSASQCVALSISVHDLETLGGKSREQEEEVPPPTPYCHGACHRCCRGCEGLLSFPVWRAQPGKMHTFVQ